MSLCFWQGWWSSTYPVDTISTVKSPSMRYMALKGRHPECCERPQGDYDANCPQNAPILGFWRDVCDGNDNRQFGKAYANHIEEKASVLSLELMSHTKRAHGKLSDSHLLDVCYLGESEGSHGFA